MEDLNPAAAPVESPASVESPPAAEPSLRDTIDEAFEKSATDEVQADASGPVRDEAGRFAPKTPATAAQSLSGAPKAAPQGVTSPPPRPGATEGAPQGEPVAPELKAPAQWKPEARERWQGVDPLVKQEVNRREREFQTHLQQSAGLRDFVQAFENTVRPYEMFIRAENSSPLAAVANLFQTAAALRVETPVNKAQLVAGLCQQYAIDLGMLDTALARVFGVRQANGQLPAMPQQQEFRDPRVDQFLMQQNMMAQQQQEAQAQEIYQSTAEFAASHEFFDDVRDDMADMIEIAARRGQILPVQQAYEKACQLNPEVAKIAQSRNSATSAKATTQAALRARRAASSVKGESSPHGVTTPANDSLRASIEAAFEQAGTSRL